MKLVKKLIATLMLLTSTTIPLMATSIDAIKENINKTIDKKVNDVNTQISNINKQVNTTQTNNSDGNTWVNKQTNIIQNNTTQISDDTGTNVIVNNSVVNSSVSITSGNTNLRKGTVEFKIGESTYSVDGKKVPMDAISYIQEPGFTMVAVRYVAESFGIASDAISFSGDTITIHVGDRTIVLENNSNIAYINNEPIQMAAPVIIKDERTYAPIGEVAIMLGINKNWDSETQTAIFQNE